jgi:uncharacterized protein (DUF58 family)
MIGYYIFIFVLILILVLAEITGRKGFDRLSIRREMAVNSAGEGEDIKLSIIIENNKWLPISFLLISEKIPNELGFFEDESMISSGESNYHTTRLNIKGYEMVKRSYTITSTKRGTYLLRDVRVSLGDAFGIYTNDKEFQDFEELLVYPKLIDLQKLEFNTTSFLGDTIIKRWIYKDPLYIKGIKEYNVEDRMKDIHWKSSLKMNKLMVKDYDYTAEMELMIIFNVECGEPYWSSIDGTAIERGAALCASLSNQSIKEGISVGLWTNSQLVNYGDETIREVMPSLNSFSHIMEFCARIDYTPRLSFNEYLIEKSRNFNKNTTYVIVSAFLNDESIAVISRLVRSGFMLKLIDVSSKSNIPFINGIEKATYNN